MTDTLRGGEPVALSNRFLIGLCALWCAATIPLLHLGYGSDSDTWAVAQVAEHFFATHTYQISRSSGFPLFEIGSSPFVHAGPYWVANLPSLFAALSLLGAFAYLGRIGHFTHPRIVLVTLAFLPVFIKNATSLIDYLGALSFLTWAYVALVRGRLFTSAALIGVAAGFRPTSALMIAPVLTHVYLERRSVALVAKLAVTAGGVATAAYSPVLVTYGLRTGFKDMALSSSAKLMMVGYNALTLFGALQTVLVAGIVAHSLWRRTKEGRSFARAPLLRFHLVNVGVYCALFVFMPHEPEYLFPIAPSLMILLDAALDARSFALVGAVLLSYHVVRVELLGGASGHRTMTLRIAPGYTYRDIQARRFALSIRAAATAYRPERATIFMSCVDEIAGNNRAFEYIEKQGMFKQREGLFYSSVVVYRNERLAALRARGARIVIWKGQLGELAFRRRGDDSWKQYVEEISGLDELFGVHVEGAPLY